MSDTKDEIVDKVLQGLRVARPPEGMEDRVVRAVRYRAFPVARRSSRRVVALAGSAALGCMVCGLFVTAHRTTPVPHSPAFSISAGNSVLVPATTGTRKPVRPATPRKRLTTGLPLKENLAAVSYPAPPMPLTEQEKLLLRLAHKGDPIELAMLDPARREAKYADERTQVQSFFTPPKQEITSEP